MMPPALGRFSITTCWPVRSDKLLADQPHGDVGKAAGAERHDDAERAVGEGRLRGRRADRGAAEQQRGQQRQHLRSTTQSSLEFRLAFCFVPVIAAGNALHPTARRGAATQ